MAAEHNQSSIFRQEALEAHRGGDSGGDVLRLSPRWVRRAFWVLTAAVAAALVFSVVAHVTEFAPGPAVLRVNNRAEVRVTSSGVIETVAVRPGQAVEPGQVLVRIYPLEELAAVERMTREIQGGASTSLGDEPSSVEHPTLAALQAQRLLAEARLASRAVVAPRAGVVGDVRVRAGQRVEAGEVILTTADRRPAYTVVALLPGQYRPMLRPGMPLRLELAGFRYTYRHLVIRSVAEEIMGPEEVRHVLGPELAEAVQVTGPVALVQARVEGRGFEFEGQTMNFYHGMTGTAEAAVRSRSLILTLVPALEIVFPDAD